MSGETEDQVSGWTVDTLRAHLLTLLREKDLRDQQRFDGQQIALRDALSAQEKAVLAALNAAEAAVKKAENAAEKRFESINEFRGQLADQAAELMPRKETTVLLDALASRMAVIESRVNEGGGRGQGLAQAWGFLIGIVGIIGVVAAVVVAVTK